jgi:hypothetical protein
VPVTVTCAIVRAAVPVLLTLNVCDFVCPSTTLPKLNVVGDTLSSACTPVPVNATVNGESLASLVTVIVPVAIAVAVGANPTVSVTLCDAFTLAGTVTPLTLNPAPLALIFEILAVAFPVFVSTICFEALVPMFTFPKLRLVGFAVSCPT